MCGLADAQNGEPRKIEVDDINSQVNTGAVVLREVRKGTTCTLVAVGSYQSCPLLFFLEQLLKDNPGEAARVAALLDRTAEHGPPKDKTKCRFFKALQIFELKTRGGVRVMAFWDEGRLIVCSHAFMKKSQKTPENQKELALDAKASYFRAKARKNIRIVD
ncbi:MAG: type II toxin-antitoxin system RelE/ParE family toxin [Kiritimatiellia bacterium]